MTYTWLSIPKPITAGISIVVNDMQKKRYCQRNIKSFSCSMNDLLKIQQRDLLSLVFTAGLALMICSASLGHAAGLNALSPRSGETASPVTIEQNSQWNATIYTISGAGCTIQWIARNSEIGVIKHWSRCTASLSEQLPLWEKICAEFFSKDKNAQAFRTLFWGRLEPETQNGSHELSLRLSLAAYQSPGWDVKRGKPKSGDVNGFIRDIANTKMIYPELKKLFGRFQRSIAFSSAEKVLITEAAKLPYYEQLKQRGVKAADRLPFDCVAWFTVSHVSSPIQQNATEFQRQH
jgi:hypothetical protein